MSRFRELFLDAPKFFGAPGTKINDRNSGHAKMVFRADVELRKGRMCWVGLKLGSEHPALNTALLKIILE
jgi:hypothetical protein